MKTLAERVKILEEKIEGEKLAKSELKNPYEVKPGKDIEIPEKTDG